MFDGWSIADWEAINESNINLILDTNLAIVDRIYAQTNVAINRNIFDPGTREAYGPESKMTAKMAEAFLKLFSVGDMMTFGPEAELFILDDV